MIFVFFNLDAIRFLFWIQLTVPRVKWSIMSVLQVFLEIVFSRSQVPFFTNEIFNCDLDGTLFANSRPVLLLFRKFSPALFYGVDLVFQVPLLSHLLHQLIVFSYLSIVHIHLRCCLTLRWESYRSVSCWHATLNLIRHYWFWSMI